MKWSWHTGKRDVWVYRKGWKRNFMPIRLRNNFDTNLFEFVTILMQLHIAMMRASMRSVKFHTGA